MRYHLYLESGPQRKTTMVHVAELTGCIANGPTMDEALAATPDAIGAFRALLRRHRIPSPGNNAVEIEVAGHQIGGSFIGHGTPEQMLPDDWEPVTQEKLETIVATYRALRAEMERAIEGVPADGYGNTFPGSTRTPERILQHILSADQGALTNIGGKIPDHREIVRRVENSEQDARTALPIATKAAIERLQALTPEERALSRRAGLTKSYHVTAHRILRRFLEHNWEHLRQLQSLAG